MLFFRTRQSYRSLLDAAVLQPGADYSPAIIYVATDEEPVIITREVFRRMAYRYAASLSATGVVSGDLVIVAHTQNLESIFAFWGALLIGAIPSMFPTITEKLDPDIYLRNLQQLVNFSGVRLVLTTDEFASLLRDMLPCAVIGSSAVQESTPQTMIPVVSQPDEIAFLQHSSGTTGLQKGVALSHAAVLNQLAAYSDVLSLTLDDVIVSWLPLYHDMGLIAGFLLPLLQGIPLVLMSPFDWVQHPALLLRSIDAYHATLCWLPNFAYNHMARRIRRRDTAGLSLASMRAFINCSEPVKDTSHRQFLERFAPIGLTENMFAVSYAMAENTFAVTQTRFNQPPHIDYVDRHLLETDCRAHPAADLDDRLAVVSCGKPLPNTELCVLDDAGQKLPERHVGEFAIRSDCMLTEYHRRPDLQPIIDGWYRTGDMGYLADGEAYVVGRRKDLIIHAGKNIYPQDIEIIINTVEGVHPGRVVVFGVPDEREGTELIAVIAETKQHNPETHAEIVKRIRQQVVQQANLSVAYVQLVSSGWLIKTSSGKIARAANRDKWLQSRQNHSE